MRACLLLSLLAAPAVMLGAEPEKPLRDAFGDPLPAGASLRLGTTRLRHAEAASFVDFLPDGKHLVTGGQDRCLCLWEIPSGKRVRVLTLPPGDERLSALRSRTVLHAALSKDGKRLAAAEAAGPVVIWELATGKELARLVSGARGMLNGLALSPDGTQLARLEGDGTVQLWEVAARKQVGTLHSRENQPGGVLYSSGYSGVAYSPSGKQLAAAHTELDNGSIQRAITVWDLTTGKPVHRFEPADRSSYVSTPTFSPDGKYLAWAGLQGGIVLADPNTGKEMRQLKPANTTRITSLTFSPDSQHLFARSLLEDCVFVWEVATGKELPVLGERGRSSLVTRRSTLGSTREVALAPDGRLLAMCSDARIRLFDLQAGKEIIQNAGHHGTVFEVRFTGPNTITTLGDDGLSLDWDGKTSREKVRTPVPEFRYGFALSPDRKWWASEGTDGQVRLWDATTGKEKVILDMSEARASLSIMTFSPDGQTLAVRSRLQARILMFAVPSGKRLQSFGAIPTPGPGAVGGVASISYLRVPSFLAFSPDGHLLAAPDQQGALVLWDTRTGREIRKLAFGTDRPALSAAFAADGRSLLLDLGDKVVDVYEVATGQRRRTFGDKVVPVGPTSTARRPIVLNSTLKAAPQTVALAPDGRTLALAHQGVVTLWDLLTGTTVGECKGHLGEITALAFSQDGRRLITGGADTTALVWEIGARPVPAAKETAETCWEKLKSNEGEAAFVGMAGLLANANRSVSLLQTQLRPAGAVDSERVQQLIEDLDSRRFVVRQKATEQLEQMGGVVADALRKALQQKPSAETERRLEELLDRVTIRVLSGDQLRNLRAIEVLEWLATAEARELLRKLATGASGALETQEAQAALRRLEARR